MAKKPSKTGQWLHKQVNHEGKEITVEEDGKTILFCPQCDAKRPMPR